MPGLGGNVTPEWKLLLSEGGGSLSQLTQSSANWVSSGGEIYNTDTGYSRAHFSTVPLGPYLAHIIEAEIKFPSGGSGVKRAGVHFGAEAGSEAGVAPVDMGEYGAAALVDCDYTGPTFDPSIGLAVDTWFHLRLVLMQWVASVWIDGVHVDSVALTHHASGYNLYCDLHRSSGDADFTIRPGIFTDNSGAGNQPKFRNIRHYVMPIRLPGS